MVVLISSLVGLSFWRRTNHSDVWAPGGLRCSRRRCPCAGMLFATPWSIAYQSPLSVEFSKQEYWSGLPFPSLGNLPNPALNPCFLRLLHWQAGSLPAGPPGSIKNQFKTVVQDWKVTWEETEHCGFPRGQDQHSHSLWLYFYWSLGFRSFPSSLNNLNGIMDILLLKMLQLLPLP